MACPFFAPMVYWSYGAEFVGFFAGLAGVVGGLFWIVAGVFEKSKRVLALGLIVGILSGFVLSSAFEWTKVRATFFLNRSYYQQQADLILKSKNPAEVEKDDDIIVDTSGGGLRIAFDLGAGFIDDFKSIVYDPNGDIMRAPIGLNDNSPFGGNYAYVQHITGPWYFFYLLPDAPPGT